MTLDVSSKTRCTIIAKIMSDITPGMSIAGTLWVDISNFDDGQIENCGNNCYFAISRPGMMSVERH